MRTSRITILKQLLDYSSSLEVLRVKLGYFEWDSEELLALTTDHIRSILKRFLGGDLSAKELEEWANLIEGRDDIKFGTLETREVVLELIHELANPLLTEILTLERAKILLEKLEK